MFKRNQLYVSLIATSLMLATGVSSAQETVTSSGSITVQNAFDFNENSGLSFGTIRAGADITVASTLVEVGSYTINPDGTNGTISDGGESDLAVLSSGAPAQYSVANASAFSTINIEIAGVTAERSGTDGDPGQSVDDGSTTLEYVPAVSLVNATAPGDNPEFDVDDFTVLESGSATVQDDAAAFAVTTDVNGAVDFAVGATIFTDSDATEAVYLDGLYSGSFVVTASY